MQNASYSIELDTERHLLRITMAGFFTEQDIALFVAARDKAIAELTAQSDHRFTLVDIREMQIQSQESVTAFQRVLSNPATISKPVAFVVSASLARLQIRRAAADRNAEYFTSLEAAENWLLN
jgi:hypothetical protein